jgi:hypothetical protein
VTADFPGVGGTAAMTIILNVRATSKYLTVHLPPFQNT